MSPYRITFELEEPTGLPRRRWPVSRGVPFPRGALDSCDHLRLLDEQGREVPLQTRLLSTWPDGSVRWAWLHFQADLKPQSRVHYLLEYGPEVERSPVPPGVQVAQRGDQLILDTGPLRAVLSRGAEIALPDQVWLDGRPMLATGEQSSFILVDAQGQVYSSRWGQVTSLTVEEAGPLRAVVHLMGDHRSPQGERLFRYEARLYAYAGLPWLELEYTFVNDQDARTTELQRIGFVIHPQVGPSRRGLCGAYQDLHESPKSFSIYADTPTNFGIFAGTRIYDDQEQLVERECAGELSHKIAHGWLDLSDDSGGVTVAVKRMAQLYPKRIAVSGDVIEVDLWPARAGLLSWHQGMARTHRILLLFHHGTGREAAVNELSTCYEQDLDLWAPDWYPQSEALGPLFAYQPRRYPHIEMTLRDQFTLWQAHNQSLGFLDYGDHPQCGQYERERYMANNEIDLAHGLALQYARTGERIYYEALEATAWHTMDVDVVHHTTFDPVELGGARIHGNQHVQYHCEGIGGVSVAPSHMWTEGLLEYYYLSGHPRALEIARGIGECLLRMLDRGWAMPPYPVSWHGARDSGWPLIALTALYEATGEEKWLTACRRIVDALLKDQGDDGAWGMWCGWYRGLSPLHLGIALTGLSRYHQLTGEERVRESLIRAADAMLQHCTFPDGALIYVTAPGFRWNYYSGVAFESLGYVWQLTGDQRYLEAGWLGHRHALGAWRVGAMATLTGTTLADWWRGNLRYMYWADQAGLLRDLSV